MLTPRTGGAGAPRTIRFSLLAALLVAAAAPATAQRDKKGAKTPAPTSVTYFDGELVGAQTQAAERNVPLLVLCVLEGEEASDRFRDELRDNRELAAATQDVIVVLVNNGRHETKRIKVKVNGKTETREVCSAFHTTTCEVHARNWDKVYQLLIVPTEPTGRFDLPQAMIVSPAWGLEKRIFHAHPPSTSEMTQALAAARVKAGPGLSADELRQVKQLRQRASKASELMSFAESWSLWNELLTIAPKGQYADEGREAREAALASVDEQLQKASKQLVPDTAADAYRKVYELGRYMEGSSLEKEIRETLKKAQRKSELKPILAKVKLELEAEELLAEADALMAEGEKKTAERLLRKLFGKKFAETPAAADGRERYPDVK